MKKICSLLVFVACALAAHAQNAWVIPQAETHTYIKPYKKFKSDTTGTALRKMYLQKLEQQNQTNSMPVAGLNSVQLTYQYNNGAGLDVYSANIDNMAVVKPDATFYSGMPNGNGVTVYSVTTAVTTDTTGLHNINAPQVPGAGMQVINGITIPLNGAGNNYILQAPVKK